MASLPNDLSLVRSWRNLEAQRRHSCLQVAWGEGSQPAIVAEDSRGRARFCLALNSAIGQAERPNARACLRFCKWACVACRRTWYGGVRALLIQNEAAKSCFTKGQLHSMRFWMCRAGVRWLHWLAGLEAGRRQGQGRVWFARSTIRTIRTWDMRFQCLKLICGPFGFRYWLIFMVPIDYWCISRVFGHAKGERRTAFTFTLRNQLGV